MIIAILVIGNLGETGEISIKSLMKLEPERVCVVSNNSGKDWLNSLNLLNNELLCFHRIKENCVDINNVILSLEHYSSYRTLNFDLLTSLKWHLILEVITGHTDTHRVLYSDLDIYWRKRPSEEIIYDLSENIWVQYTPSNLRKNWFCTGIMSWSNSANTKVALNKLVYNQNYSFNSGNPANDEVTFNQSYDTLPIEIKKMPTKEYLIGKEFNKIFIAHFIYFPNLVCFHANYIIGNDLKAKILRIVKIRLSSKITWIRYVPFVIAFNFKDLFSRIVRRLK